MTATPGETATVTIPLRVWGRLATAADNRDVTIEDLLVEAILGVICAPTERAARVVALAQAGYSDTEICQMTGELRAYVATARRDRGIKATKHRRPHKLPIQPPAMSGVFTLEDA